MALSWYLNAPHWRRDESKVLFHPCVGEDHGRSGSCSVIKFLLQPEL